MIRDKHHPKMNFIENLNNVLFACLMISTPPTGKKPTGSLIYIANLNNAPIARFTLLTQAKTMNHSRIWQNSDSYSS